MYAHAHDINYKCPQTALSPSFRVERYFRVGRATVLKIMECVIYQGYLQKTPPLDKLIVVRFSTDSASVHIMW